MDTRARTNRLWRHALGYSAPLLLWTSVHAAEPGEIIEEVQVTGIRQSLRDALSVKLNSDLVVDAISSEDIGQLPDVTIAESINRLPGINATRDRGNDSQAVVRGLGARLVLGTINGREVASSEPDRNVRWEIYPSEVVSGVKVYKTQSADLIAAASRPPSTFKHCSRSTMTARTSWFVAGPCITTKARTSPTMTRGVIARAAHMFSRRAIRSGWSSA